MNLSKGFKMFNFEREAIYRATERLRNTLRDNLIAVIAFGSRVRGDFSGESDFDILVIVKKRDYQVIKNITEVFTEEEDKTGIPFSPIVKPVEVIEKEKAYNTTFYRNIKKEGVIFYGRA